MCAECTDAEIGLLVGFAVPLAFFSSLAFQYGLRRMNAELGESLSTQPTYSYQHIRGTIMFATTVLALGALNGVIVGREIDHMSTPQSLIFVIGVLMCITGIWM